MQLGSLEKNLISSPEPFGPYRYPGSQQPLTWLRREYPFLLHMPAWVWAIITSARNDGSISSTADNFLWNTQTQIDI